MAVYFLQELAGERLIKIGKANNVLLRFSQVRHMVSQPIEILGYIEGDEREEKLLHKVFAPFRKHGEWFEPVELLASFISQFTTRPPKRRVRPARIVPLERYSTVKNVPAAGRLFVNPLALEIVEAHGAQNIPAGSFFAAVAPLRQKFQATTGQSRRNSLIQIKRAYEYLTGNPAPDGVG